MAATQESTVSPAIQELMRGYSCPSEFFSPDLHDALVSGYAQDSLAHVLKLFRMTMAKTSPSATQALEALSTRAFGAEMAWDTSFGILHETITNTPEADVLMGATAQVLLWSALKGEPSNWDVHFQSPRQLRFGPWLMPPVQALTCRTEPDEIVLGGDLQARLTLDADGHWQSPDLDQMPSFGIGKRRIYLVAEPELLHEQRDRQRLVTAVEELAKMQQGCQQAIDYIDACAPEFLDWVFRAIRYVYPFREEKGAVASGSIRNQYGQIHLSYTRNVLLLAESFVHEAAHQHYYIATRMSPVDDGSDEIMYYSPPVDAMRRVDKILLAFHAFVNVIMLTRRFKGTRYGDPGYVSRNEGLVSEMLDQLIAPLENNAALTPVGRALADPLIEYFR